MKRSIFSNDNPNKKRKIDTEIELLNESEKKENLSEIKTKLD